MKVLVAGVGNILRADDGFGVVCAQRLAEIDLGEDVRVIETGTGGIHLVQELFTEVDALIVLDAVQRDRPPGTVMVIQPEVADVNELPDLARWDWLADMHYTKPERAFMLARALGVLPPRFLLVGCQPLETDELTPDLSPVVHAAVPVAIAEVQRLIAELRAEPAAVEPA